MTPARPSERSTIASFDKARFDKLMAARADAQAKLAAAEANLSAFCRAYSQANRTVNLTPEQVRRDMEARG